MDALQAEAKKLQSEGLQASALAFDVTNTESIEKLAREAGEIDIFIAVSGTNIRRKFQNYTPDQYAHIMQTNLHGLFTLGQRIGAGMVERKRGGKVIFIGSLTSLVGLPYLTVYSMTKAGLAGLTRSLAAEWGRENIQVNCIAPGFILTDLNREMWQPDEMRVWRSSVQANPRMGTPEDIAPVAVFLSSRGSDYITGQVIAVDGGYTATAVWPFEVNQ